MSFLVPKEALLQLEHQLLADPAPPDYTRPRTLPFERLPKFTFRSQGRLASMLLNDLPPFIFRTVRATIPRRT